MKNNYTLSLDDLFPSWYTPEEDVDEQVEDAIKKKRFSPAPKEEQTNQGRAHCYRCGTKTVKVDSGMYTIFDVCPQCKI